MREDTYEDIQRCLSCKFPRCINCLDHRGVQAQKDRKRMDRVQELYDKGRVFSHAVLKPGCEVGWHIHQGEGETYYILKGVGTYNDDGTTLEVFPGDVTFTDSGQGHAIKNNGEEDLEFIALILY